MAEMRPSSGGMRASRLSATLSVRSRVSRLRPASSSASWLCSARSSTCPAPPSPTFTRRHRSDGGTG